MEFEEVYVTDLAERLRAPERGHGGYDIYDADYGQAKTRGERRRELAVKHRARRARASDHLASKSNARSRRKPQVRKGGKTYSSAPEQLAPDHLFEESDPESDHENIDDGEDDQAVIDSADDCVAATPIIRQAAPVSKGVTFSRSRGACSREKERVCASEPEQVGTKKMTYKTVQRLARETARLREAADLET